MLRLLAQAELSESVQVDSAGTGRYEDYLIDEIIPFVDAYSVWKGPTHDIVAHQKHLFSTLSFAFPVPGEHGSANLGLPDLLFFAVFLGATARFGLRTGLTWICMTLSFGTTTLLGAFAGLTIFLGLPIARARRLAPSVVGALNAIAIGILVYLIVEIAGSATTPLLRALSGWHNGATGHGAPTSLPVAMLIAYVGGLLVGLVGLGALAARFTKAGASAGAEKPLALAGMIAIGIGAHNFAEGLAVGLARWVGLAVAAWLHAAGSPWRDNAPSWGRVTL